MTTPTNIDPKDVQGYFAKYQGEKYVEGWAALWDKGDNLPWDRGFPNPALEDTLVQRAGTIGGAIAQDGQRRKALVPGCGRGVDVLLLASFGYDAYGLECSAMAVDACKKEEKEKHSRYRVRDEKVGKGRVTFVQGGFFDDTWLKEIGVPRNGFNVIYDYTFFCARMCGNAEDKYSITPVNCNDLPAGTIRWGMLQLNPKTGRFEIDQEMVDEHISELSRQLKGKQNSVFAWIQAWNTYAATFFTSNFGKPANCFGRSHVDNMLATHERIQRQIFSSSGGSDFDKSVESKLNGSVIEYLKWAIRHRFGVNDIPDGYFYFPTELGGLEVRNPFIGLLQIRDSVLGDANKLLDEFEYAEREAYQTAKKMFENGMIYRADRHFRPEDGDRFFSFQEYIKYRECLPFSDPGSPMTLQSVYNKFLEEPVQEAIETAFNGDIHTALTELDADSKSILNSWESMEPYWKWVTQLYGPDVIENFGGLRIVDSGLLPIGMVSLFRSGRVKWQE